VKIASLKFSDALDQLPEGEEYSGYNESTDIQPEELVQESPTVQRERRSLRRYRLDPQEGEMWYQVGLNQDMDVRPENERAITPYSQNRPANPKFSAEEKQEPSFYDIELDNPDGAIKFYNEKGQSHRLDGPAIEYPDGHKEWWANNKLHRLDGPAVEWPDGTKFWWVNGRPHRLDGPAVIWPDGHKEWWVEGKLHRLDGPAIIWEDGSKEWWVNNECIGKSEEGFTQKDFNQWKKEHGFIKAASLKFSVKEKPLFHDVEIDDEGNISYYNEKGQLHRLDGPAIKKANGTNEWYVNGKKHREDGPAVEYLNGGKEWWVNNKLHRLDGPAIEEANGTKWWYVHGKCHRLDGPAYEGADGTKVWYVDGKRHRLDGPAIEWADGTKWWFTNDKLHRLDGPAIEFPDGTKQWYVNDKLHRLDGPAEEWADGTKAWYVNGKLIGMSTRGFTDEKFEQWKKEHGL